MASCPDSDNSWVLAGAEGLPVETLGPEPGTDPESERDPQMPRQTTQADGAELAGALDGEENFFQTERPQAGPTVPEETEAETAVGSDGPGVEPPGPGDTELQGDLQETPMAASLGPDMRDPEDQSTLQSPPSTPKTGWIREEGCCSTSEDDTDMDVEGLRRRWGPQLSPPPTAAPFGVEDQARAGGAGGELGISLNMCLLGALVLLGLGVLLFSGGLSELDTGPVEEAELQVFSDAGSDAELVGAEADGQDRLREQLQASVSADSVPSLQNMGLLLDRLAKENQDIRLLQAQLQAQKEELQSLMQQPKELEEENARLKGALQQGEASQQALESELQQLRTRIQALGADCTQGPDGVCLSWGHSPQGGKATMEQDPGSSFLEEKAQLEAEAQVLRRELQRQRQLLNSVQQDLQRSLRDAGRGDPAHAGLAELGHRLAQMLKGLQNWGLDPGALANASEAWHQKPQRAGKGKWHDGQRDGKAEHWKHRKESGWERRKSFGGEDREPAGRWKEDKPGGEKWGAWKDGKQQDPKEPAWKSSSHHSGERQEHSQGREGPKDSQDSLPHWAELLRRKYRAPQGCSGVAGCARQEGLAFFGTELAPVRQQELASLLRTYLGQLPWAGQLAKKLPFSPAYFDEDGVFRHDRLRFRDFVDALEDSLEEVAARWTGDDDEVDDFEDFIFSHLLGDKALKRRSGKRDKHFRSPRVVGPREEHRPQPYH
ncbi:Pre-B-cell leukemia transcription factor-interacting protein 1 [Heterocephalus glaber]|uniref:Pre-B-cell leukemia transcription factor-interacting protein 1 n=1 Tax=Heterocephalus glaber TaxID=10181 RepID=G5BDD8_HETGA|nr:pre-B-cell leukemia transcription factor-interacting protein 1 [Heterocephalus glaber]XP_004871389.1 pre-B-cell leukemia transcription factor-interacting protein 1 [Heterocephalus glaber]XP_004871390.1 pre-B-cell leukemia transcription factor-interacting protein 1 [Heterocephalus glaber]XP_021104927.1 pre-B-cell leukemia transcription factor-interacting protein 1 [Heterocephalus glaber]XP_021104928.1 pre-B-cell leukemia transcription factor-interacting protein 1 [Heterocephalus glaber]XP_02